MPKVSVLLPSYNHEKFVSECIQSVLNQSYDDFEFIIVDDGSSDNTVNEIKKFNDDRIKLICFEKNQGACVAMNKCIDEMRGEYASIINSDDVYMPNKLERQVKFLDEHKEYGAVFSYAEIIDENGNELTEKDKNKFDIFVQNNRNRFEWLNYFFYKGNCLLHPSIMIRKKCYDETGKFDERFSLVPDYDYWIRLCMKYDIYVQPEKLIKYRVRNNSENVSALKPETIIRSSWETNEILKNYLKIKTSDELCRVFPQLCNKQVEDDYIPYIIARLALNVANGSYKTFGMHVLYNLMGNEEIAKKIREKYNFKYTDLIDLSGKVDALNLSCNNKSKLFINIGKGFSEKYSLSKEIYIYSKNFKLSFDLSEYRNIKSLRWDPIEGKICNVKVSSVEYSDESGNIHLFDINKISSNGALDKDIIKFDTFDPMIFIPISNVKYLNIIGEWEFVNYIDYENNYIKKYKNDIGMKEELITKQKSEIDNQEKIICKQKSEIDNKDLKIILLQNQLKTLFESTSWKVTKPFRILSNLVSKNIRGLKK